MVIMMSLNYFQKNEEIENKIKIIQNGEIKIFFLKYIFNKEGKYSIYLIQENYLNSMLGMFYDCSLLQSINLSPFNTNNVTDMKYMFYNCSSLKNISLSSFNTNNVTDMRNMFDNYSSLKEINLSSFNTSNVTNMESMFGMLFIRKD